MAYKPEIQHVGQFYVYGSEAKQVAPKRKPQFQLPKPKHVKIEKIYVDPVALLGIMAAVVMLVAMVVGACRIHSSWQEYEQVVHELSVIQREHARLEHNYNVNIDLEKVADEAQNMGLVPLDQIPSMSVRVTVPVPEPEMTAWDEFVWFIQGLFA